MYVCTYWVLHYMYYIHVPSVHHYILLFTCPVGLGDIRRFTKIYLFVFLISLVRDNNPPIFLNIDPFTFLTIS